MLSLIESYLSFISNPHFPCVAAKAAYAHDQIRCFVAESLESDSEDHHILEFIYNFVDHYRQQKSLYHSATLIFKQPEIVTEEQFDTLLWKKLQSLSTLDAKCYKYDARVSSNPASPHFSYSLKEEAFFVIGLHPASSRLTRRFAYPTIVLNPHEQFEILRKDHHYESMKQTVRRRDIQLSGSINPMLDDFGTSSEAKQYSGRAYDSNWQCPLHISHGKNERNSST